MAAGEHIELQQVFAPALLELVRPPSSLRADSRAQPAATRKCRRRCRRRRMMMSLRARGQNKTTFAFEATSRAGWAAGALLEASDRS